MQGKKKHYSPKGESSKDEKRQKKNTWSDIGRIRVKEKVDTGQRVFWIFWDMDLKLNER